MKCARSVQLTDTFQNGQPHFSEEVALGKDGTPVYILVSTSPIFNEEGEVMAAIEMSTDITQVRLLEEELKRSEEKYRTLFNSDPNPIFVLELRNLGDPGRQRTGFKVLRLRERGSRWEKAFWIWPILRSGIASGKSPGIRRVRSSR